MDHQEHQICKYHQTGFCKYRDDCKNTHVNTTCEDRSCAVKNCLKRHPKECKKYKSTNGCRFNKECAYKHLDDKDNDFKNQDKINEVVANITLNMKMR